MTRYLCTLLSPAVRVRHVFERGTYPASNWEDEAIGKGRSKEKGRPSHDGAALAAGLVGNYKPSELFQRYTASVIHACLDVSRHW